MTLWPINSVFPQRMIGMGAEPDISLELVSRIYSKQQQRRSKSIYVRRLQELILELVRAKSDASDLNADMMTS
jgi:hypothetical protein